MMAKPMKTLELHYPIIQFLIKTIIIHQMFLLAQYSPAKTEEYSRIFHNFQNCPRYKNYLKDNKHNSLHLGRKYARIYVLGHYLFLITHSFFKTVRFSEQIMSVNKYPSIFSHQMEAIVYLILKLKAFLKRIWNVFSLFLKNWSPVVMRSIEPVQRGWRRDPQMCSSWLWELAKETVRTSKELDSVFRERRSLI